MKCLKTTKEEYAIRLKKYHSLAAKYTKNANIISNLRLLIFFTGVGITIYLYYKNLKDISLFSFLFFFLVFIYLIKSHEEAINNYKINFLLEKVNEDSINRIDGKWTDFQDDGEKFKDKKHPYSEDLDIFGKGSLFQYINVCKTYIGVDKLRRALSEPLKNVDIIHKIQDSVSEIALKVDFRQRLQAEGMFSEEVLHDPKHLLEWSCERDTFFQNSLTVVLVRVLPFCTVASVLVFFLSYSIPYYVPLLLLLTQIFFLALRFRRVNVSLSVADKYKDNIIIYDRMLKLCTEEDFKSEGLNLLKNKLYNKRGQDAGCQIRSLGSIAHNMISMRRHQLYLVFNVLTLWDYQCQIALERWKETSGAGIREWLDVIGEFEKLSSLAIIRYDNQHWCMPVVLNTGDGILTSESMGHPLLHESIRISNDLNLGAHSKILLITGSNMSGKSTLLRTAGINLVLAYCGSPVCAKEFQCSIMDIYTSMRVSDNLEENISSFYSELLRIKMLTQACKAGKRVFFLLDELFKGTNSLDRHTGAKILIKNLVSYDSTGMVSTHDLELGELENEYGGIRNYHFQEYYKDSRIYFDYKLSPGVSTTRNAIYLMKMAGIDMEGDNR